MSASSVVSVASLAIRREHIFGVPWVQSRTQQNLYIFIFAVPLVRCVVKVGAGLPASLDSANRHTY